MKLLGSTKKDADKDKDSEDLPKLELVEMALLHCNLVNNSISKHPKYYLLLYLRNCQLLLIWSVINTSPHSLTMPKTTNAEFQFIQVCLADQNNRPLEIEDSGNVTLIIG